MQKQKLIFLGTGTSQGVPIIGSQHPVCLSKNKKDKRLRSSVLIQTKGKNILIDCGPDFRQQMLRENLSIVDAVLITHEHNDHMIGLDDMRPINFLTKKDIPVYAQQRVLNEVKQRFAYAFSTTKYPGVASYELQAIDLSPFFIQGVEILPIPVLHGKLEIRGFCIDKLAYLTDVSEIPKASKEKLHNLDVLVLSALRKEKKHHSHLLLEEALALIQELQPKKAYLTHLSHLIGFHEEVDKELPPNVHLAYDGLSIEW